MKDWLSDCVLRFFLWYCLFSLAIVCKMIIFLVIVKLSYKSDPPSCIYIFYTIKTDGYLDLGGLESICFYYVKCIMKKTFVFYNDRQDYTEEMSLEEKGLFLQVILDYQNWKELWDLWSIKFIRSRVKKQLDQDNMKRSEEIEKRKASWKLWWLAKSKRKQVLASASKWKHHLADNVNDNVNDIKGIYIPSEQDIKEKIKEIYTEQIVNNNIAKYRLLLLFIMKWYTIKIDKKSFDKFFADMIDKSHRYGYSWEWFADRDTLLLKAKEMYERAEWWREMKNHMSTLNKFLSPNPKK